MQLPTKTHPVFASTSTIDRIKTKLWAQMVMNKGGFETPYQAIRFFHPEKFKKPKAGKNLPRQIYRWLSGKPVPSINSVKKVNKKLPGSALWFDMPMWDCLSRKFDTHDEVDNLISRITDRAIIYKITKKITSDYRLELKSGWNIDKVISSLRYHCDANSISAMFLLISNFEVGKDLRRKGHILSALADTLLLLSILHLPDDLGVDIYQLFYDRYSYYWGDGPKSIFQWDELLEGDPASFARMLDVRKKLLNEISVETGSLSDIQIKNIIQGYAAVDIVKRNNILRTEDNNEMIKEIAGELICSNPGLI